MTNSWVGIGRLTKDPEVRYISKSQMAVAAFTVAINRGKDKHGNDRGADYIPVTVFGRQAENCEKYLAKGRLVAVQGRIQTGSYTNRDGATVYTTDVVADRVEFLEWGDRGSRPAQSGGGQSYQQSSSDYDDRDNGIPEGFAAITDEDIPF